MANVSGTKRLGSRRRTMSSKFQEFVPQAAWKEDSTSYKLLVDLPGFQKDQVKLDLASDDTLTASGEMMTKDGKCLFFEHNFSLPENCNVHDISGKFIGDILHVTVPKKGENMDDGIAQRTTDDEVPKTHENYGGGERSKDGNVPRDPIPLEHQPEACDKLEMAIKFLNRNKGIALIAVLAFYLGFVFQWCQSTAL